MSEKLEKGMGIDVEGLAQERYEETSPLGTDNPEELLQKEPGDIDRRVKVEAVRKKQQAKTRASYRKPISKGKEKPNTPEVGKTRRQPVGMRRVTEKTENRPGFHRRWVNDVEDRLQIFQEGGYTQVMDEDGAPKTRRSGGGRRAVLMEIPEELYNEDQEAKYKQWNADNQARLKPRESGFYVPKHKPI